MPVPRRRHRGQMRDTEHLAIGPDLFHFFADHPGGLAAEVRVHLVEHQNRNAVLRGEHGLECQHHPRHFAGRRDGLERLERLAGIRREQKLDLVKTGSRHSRLRLAKLAGADDFHVEAGLQKAQVVQLAFRLLDELGCDCLSRGTQRLAKRLYLFVELGRFRVQSGQFLVAPL